VSYDPVVYPSYPIVALFDCGGTYFLLVSSSVPYLRSTADVIMYTDQIASLLPPHVYSIRLKLQTKVDSIHEALGVLLKPIISTRLPLSIIKFAYGYCFLPVDDFIYSLSGRGDVLRECEVVSQDCLPSPPASSPHLSKFPVSSVAFAHDGRVFALNPAHLVGWHEVIYPAGDIFMC